MKPFQTLVPAGVAPVNVGIPAIDDVVLELVLIDVMMTHGV
jgi:hypothetical protein